MEDSRNIELEKEITRLQDKIVEMSVREKAAKKELEEKVDVVLQMEEQRLLLIKQNKNQSEEISSLKKEKVKLMISKVVNENRKKISRKQQTKGQILLKKFDIFHL
jgi:hypothetical protein